MPKRFPSLLVFGIAFGFVEATVVVYLRTFINVNNGYLNGEYITLLNLGFIAFVQTKLPVLLSTQNTSIEAAREFATIIMLISVALLASKNLRQWIGAFMIVFSVWDLFYYIFLKFLIGWPKSIFDIDIYFLIPVIWIGPVITPIIISTLLFIAGTILYSKNK